jgi:nucleoside-diphosphate-sugar epimerase
MGTLLRPLLRRDDRVLRLGIRRHDIDDLQAGEESVSVDVSDRETVAKAVQDVDAILHLGGISTEAPFEDLLQVNVVGTHNLLQAAVDAGVPKVILASSNHAVGFYRRADIPPGSDGLPDNLLPRPDSFYGWTKTAIESLGALYHDKFGIDVTVLRIGSCFPEPTDTRALATWLAAEDAAQLIELCLAQPDSGYRMLWAVSDNTRRWWSLAGARGLGYRSADDAERFAADRIARFGEPDLSDPVHDYVGGAYIDHPLGGAMEKPTVPED